MKIKLSMILTAITIGCVIFALPKLCWAQPPYNPCVYLDEHWDMARTGPGQLIWASGNVNCYHAYEECSERYDSDPGGDLTWGSEVDRKWAQFVRPIYGVWDLGRVFSWVVVFPGQDHGPYPEEAVEHVIWGSNDFDINDPGSATWAVGHLDTVFVKGWSDVGEPPQPGHACNDDYTCLWRFENMGSYRYIKLASIWPPLYDEPEIDAVKGVIPVRPPVTIPDTCVYPDKMNCIPVYLDSLPPWDVYSAQMVLLYDQTVIQANHAKTENSIAEAWGDPTYNIGTGWIAIAMAGTEPLDTTGVLVWVCFDVVGDVGDSTLLEFKDNHIILNDSTFDAGSGVIWVCPEEYDICGRVHYCLNDEPVDSAQMMISGGKEDTVYTDGDGIYQFTQLPGGLDYVVRGDKADNDRGAISAFDASLILRYVVGLLDLSGCQMIAADVTGNCWVNAYDASFILKYVVGLIPQFPIGKDWKFIPADFPLDTLNWCTAPDSIFYDSLSEDKCCEDWMGILYGDLTGNWDNLPLVGRDSQQDVLSRLVVKELLVNRGEEFVVPIQVENISDVYAVELNLSYDNSLLSLVDVKAGDLLEGYYFEKNLTSKEIRLAMAGAHPVYGSGALAYLTFKVLPQAQEGITTQLQVDRFCLNETASGGSAFNISIGSGSAARPLDFSLFQNYPNPFNPETEIGFSVPAACQVELKIYNIAGQLVKAYQGDYAAGVWSIIWDGTNMKGEDVGSGIYFYRMEAGKFVQQKKMVLMR